MLSIFLQYLEWQFLDTPKEILKIWKGFLRFNLEYWSLPLLLKTFFSHWRRYRYSYGRGLDPKRYFEAFTFNLISRIMGAILRSVFIVFGLLESLLIIAVGLAVFFLWVFLPFLLILGFFYGFKILF